MVQEGFAVSAVHGCDCANEKAVVAAIVNGGFAVDDVRQSFRQHRHAIDIIETGRSRPETGLAGEMIAQGLLTPRQDIDRKSVRPEAGMHAYAPALQLRSRRAAVRAIRT
jgi:hypothetical protein